MVGEAAGSTCSFPSCTRLVLIYLVLNDDDQLD